MDIHTDVLIYSFCRCQQPCILHQGPPDTRCVWRPPLRHDTIGVHIVPGCLSNSMLWQVNTYMPVVISYLIGGSNLQTQDDQLEPQHGTCSATAGNTHHRQKKILQGSAVGNRPKTCLQRMTSIQQACRVGSLLAGCLLYPCSRGVLTNMRPVKYQLP